MRWRVFIFPPHPPPYGKLVKYTRIPRGEGTELQFTSRGIRVGEKPATREIRV